jgi:hypothetical protein
MLVNHTALLSQRIKENEVTIYGKTLRYVLTRTFISIQGGSRKCTFIIIQLNKLIMRTSPVAHIFTAPKLISIRSIILFAILDIIIVLYGYTDPLMTFATLNLSYLRR